MGAIIIIAIFLTVVYIAIGPIIDDMIDEWRQWRDRLRTDFYCERCGRRISYTFSPTQYDRKTGKPRYYHTKKHCGCYRHYPDPDKDLTAHEYERGDFSKLGIVPKEDTLFVTDDDIITAAEDILRVQEE